FRPASRRGRLALVRLRTAKDRLKIEHSIIDGVREILEEFLAANPAIRSVIPGVIRPVRDAKGKVKVRVTVPTQNGWKAIALSAGRPAGAVRQHAVGEGNRRGRLRAGRRYTFSITFSSPASDVSVEYIGP